MARRAGVLAGLACGCAIAVVALWLAANDLAAGRELDAALGDDIQGFLPASATTLVKGASSLADILPVAVGASALAGLAWLRGGRRLALCVSLVLLVANALTQLAQAPLTAARHVDLAGTSLRGSGSWPSGHATAAMLLALGAILIAGPRLRAVTALVGTGYALGVGFALAAIGGHLPSDVLAGYLVAAAFTLAGAAVYALVLRRAVTDDVPADRPARSPRLAPALGALAGGAVLATSLGKALLTRPDEVARAIDDVPLVLGATAFVTVVAVLGASASLVLRR
jgi:membrane-associated phospholipid phosphatase